MSLTKPDFENHKCNARTRTGTNCRKAGMASNGRCRLHGGLNPGAPKGNKNRLVHGLYSDSLIPEELKAYTEAEVGSLEHEIRLAKAKLVGMLNLAKIVPLDLQALDLDLNEKHEDTPTMAMIREQRYGPFIRVQLDLIRKLEATQSLMTAQAMTDGDVEDEPERFTLMPDESPPENPVL